MTEAGDHDRILAWCDEELPADEAAALERAVAKDPTLRDRVAFERSLRQAVGRVLAEDRAPGDLAERIRASLAAAADCPADRPAERGDQRLRESPVAGRIRISWAAVAAVLVLVAGAVLAGILLPQIDDWPTMTPQQLTAAGAAEHIELEHTACASDRTHRQRKLTWTDPATASFEASRHLGQPVNILDFAPLDFEFVAAGPSALPGRMPSVHVVYARPETEGRMAAMLSLFISPDVQQFADISELGPRHFTCCTRVTKVMNDGQLVYFVCCCDPAEVGRLAEATARGYGCRMGRTAPGAPVP